MFMFRRLRARSGLGLVKRSFASSPKEEVFDLIVVGGGSGGLACAKEAGDLGANVAVLDAVAPTPHGFRWGLGGTCVNVGCIPKKLMHQAALVGHCLRDAHRYGWCLSHQQPIYHDWKILGQAVQNHIKSLNWGHRVQLKSKNVTYFNAFGSFLEPHLIKASLLNGKEKFLRGSNIVISTGLRPKYPKIPGAELGISSDDVFALSESPGRCLVVGSSYVALECAGFLHGLRHPTTVLIRSIPLRGFDQQMARLITDSMAEDGVELRWAATPSGVKRTAGGLEAEWREADQDVSREFDTVLWAIGREARLGGMGLESVGVTVHPESGLILADQTDCTAVPGIFAIGDIQHDRPQLTPSAIQAGKLLSRRLFSGDQLLMDYEQIPTTVFTPLEYGVVGLSEEAAVERHGEDAIEVYHAFYKPLEYVLPERNVNQCYTKAVCLRESPQTVLGLHFLGPNAGEVTQGFSVALKCGMRLEDLTHTIGIHPTCAEEITKLRITKRSGKDPTVTGC